MTLFASMNLIKEMFTSSGRYLKLFMLYFMLFIERTGKYLLYWTGDGLYFLLRLNSVEFLTVFPWFGKTFLYLFKDSKRSLFLAGGMLCKRDTHDVCT